MYDITLKTEDGIKTFLHCHTKHAISILNTHLEMLNIDLFITQAIFYNITSRREKAPQIIRWLLSGGDITIRKYNKPILSRMSLKIVNEILEQEEKPG
jgi:hypothetical protein